MRVLDFIPTLPQRPDLGHAFLDGILAVIWFLLGLARGLIIAAIIVAIAILIIAIGSAISGWIIDQFADHPRRSFAISGILFLALLYLSGLLAIPTVQWIGGVLVTLAIILLVALKVIQAVVL